MESHPPLHLGVVAIEKGAFGSPSTKVTNFTIYMSIKHSIIKTLMYSKSINIFFFFVLILISYFNVIAKVVTCFSSYTLSHKDLCCINFVKTQFIILPGINKWYKIHFIIDNTLTGIKTDVRHLIYGQKQNNGSNFTISYINFWYYQIKLKKNMFAKDISPSFLLQFYT